MTVWEFYRVLECLETLAKFLSMLFFVFNIFDIESHEGHMHVYLHVNIPKVVTYVFVTYIPCVMSPI